MKMLRSVCAALTLLVTASGAVQAGGIDGDHDDGNNTVFFGIVQDARGATIAGAQVHLKSNSMSFVVSTDATGGYRMAVPTDPDQSEISCGKTGHRQTGTQRRTPDGSKGPIEINCTLQKTP